MTKKIAVSYTNLIKQIDMSSILRVMSICLEQKMNPALLKGRLQQSASLCIFMCPQCETLILCNNNLCMHAHLW